MPRNIKEILKSQLVTKCIKACNDFWGFRVSGLEKRKIDMSIMGPLPVLVTMCNLGFTPFFLLL